MEPLKFKKSLVNLSFLSLPGLGNFDLW